MKKSIQSISFLLTGLLLVSSCSEDPIGESPEKIIHEIVVDQDELANDSIPLDTLTVEDTLEIRPTPVPIPIEPEPPIPWPEPDPIPYPWPNPDEDIPEPPPPPVFHKSQKEEVVEIPDVPAEFPDGEEAMFQFIRENIKYPRIDLEMNNQGQIYVQFIVEKNGELTNIKVMKGVSPTLDAEALRIMKMMPNWKPAESKEEIVRSISRLPITFRLN